MCLAVPSKIIRINDLMATIDVMGARREISLMILPEEVKTGDYVLVHAGFAIQKVQEDVALDSLNLINEIVREMQEEH
ncbi:MAG TPA: HypC/HybG/HupF family hydrogenase formation chaperone [Nitrospirae bacterium]|nr:HypC/HybG/HupF family hydrogenase formation chaperone [Nitrospirota bacterium]